MPRRSTPNPLAQAIGQRIRQLRKEQGLTAEKLAYESEVGSKGFVSDIEHGLALPSLVTLERIAQRLEIELFDLLVVPERSCRDKVIELTRQLGKGPLTRLLRELEESDATRGTRAVNSLHPLRAYPSLQVAAGWAITSTTAEPTGLETVYLPGRFNRTLDYAVRASGTSMQGFRSLIRNGDWLVLRKHSEGPKSILGKVVVLSRRDRFGDVSLHLKRVVEKGKKLYFRSDDPDVPPMAATDEDEILATLRAVVSPSSLAPPLHTRVAKGEVAALFGLNEEPTAPHSRANGHLFFFTKAGEFDARGAHLARISPLPAETAFVMQSAGSKLEYVGISHFDSDTGRWKAPSPGDSEK
jgi:transcriptional regulator with XRE-family HTH domain